MTPINIDPIRESLSRSLIGKRFRYQTHYNGEVFGVIKDIGIEHIMAFDQITESGIAKLLTSKGHKDLPSKESPVTTAPGPKWAGIKIRPFIISEQGISYGLDEVHILSKYEPMVSESLSF